MARRRSEGGATIPTLPGELNGAHPIESATLQEVPTEQHLVQWLEARGVSTNGWGDGVTKSVGKLWKELKRSEAGLDVWRTAEGKSMVMRSTHVLRGKVCSQLSYERGVFLFNTWQQFADGRKRTRNGLLSEKLNTEEIPLEDHLHEVCQRAVEEEEMGFLIDTAFVISPTNPPPDFDPEYKCPLKVIDEKFVDYTIEVEESKSFPGLQTAYHLYTVDIICSGLPGVDFNTLEYNDPDDGAGKRKLKYVHAWNWLNWPTIQRYLFEGSQLKETKKKGAFTSPEALEIWLMQHSLSTERWGTEGFKSCAALLKEIENDESQLELWGRHDGVQLLMRVVHVLQLKVISDDPRLQNKFLLQTWSQSRDGRVRDVSRLMSKKLTCAQVPFDESRFNRAAETVVQSQINYLADVHFSLNPGRPPTTEDMNGDPEVDVLSTKLVGMHHDIEESPSFPGLHTMYHLYTMEVECSGLPHSDFTSVDFERNGGPFAYGWKWRTLPESLDILHSRAQALERQDNKRRRALQSQTLMVTDNVEHLERILGIAQRMAEESSTSSGSGAGVLGPSQDVSELVHGLAEAVASLRSVAESSRLEEQTCAGASLAESLPPAMLSKMASDTITTDSFFEEVMAKQRTETVGRSSTSSGGSRSMRATTSIRAWVPEASDIPEETLKH